MASRREVGIPRGLTDLKRWPGYVAGMGTEAAYAIVLMAAAFAVALIAWGIWP